MSTPTEDSESKKEDVEQNMPPEKSSSGMPETPGEEEVETRMVNKFMGTSSFHGLIQAYEHRNIFNRISWSICMLVCCTGFIVHLWSLLDRFIGLPTTIDLVSTVIPDPFPSITFCPSKFISEAKWASVMSQPRSQIEGMSLEDYYNDKLLENWKNVYNMSGEDLEDSRTIGKFWDATELSMYRYQKFFNIDISRKNYEMILYCEVNNKPCSWRDFIPMDQYTYKRCFEFRTPYPNEVPDNLVVLLFVGDDITRLTEDMKTIVASDGAFFTFNEMTLYPETERSFEFLPSGFHTDVRVHQEGNLRINKERAPCFNDKYMTRTVLSDYHYANSTSVKMRYKHNIINCRQYYQQIFSADRCGCLNPDLPVFEDVVIKHPRIRFCDEMAPLNPDMDAIVTRMHCVSRLVYNNTFGQFLSDTCYSLCDQVSYDIRSFSMPWIGYTLIEESNFIMEKMDKHFKEVAKEVDANVLMNPSVMKANNCKDAQSMLKCFLLFRVLFESNRKEVIREYEAYLIRNLFSDFGGIMGLWVGISLVTIVELVHVIVALSKQKTHRAATVIQKSVKYQPSMKKNDNKKPIAPGVQNPSYQVD